MIKTIREEFRLNENIIYLNHAAVSPWPMRTAKAVQDFAEENMAQGSAQYLRWHEIESNLRRQARQLLNAPSTEDIALLKNTSEALSVVAYGLDWKQGDNVVISNQEFPSNRIVWESLANKGVELREANISAPDIDTPEDALFSMVNSRTRLLSISSVQYSTGLRMDLKKIGAFCNERGILYCVDAIQSLGAMKFDVQEIQADFVMADGHKWMLGPEGLAIFYSRPEARNLLTLNQYGWHMIQAMGDFDRKEWKIADSARRFECGSPNTLGIHALNASLSLLLEVGIEHIEKQILQLSKYLFDKISSIPELELITPSETGRYAGIVTFRHCTADNAALQQDLTDRNAICSLRNGHIRLSPHFYTSKDQLERVADMIEHYGSHRIDNK